MFVRLIFHLAVELTVDSDYLEITFKNVVEHIHGMVLGYGYWVSHARDALEILIALVKKSSGFLHVDVAWICQLLGNAARGKIDDKLFAQFLRLRALGKSEDEQTVASENTLIEAISRTIKTCSEQGEGWNDLAVYGGLAVLSGMRQLGSYPPDLDLFKTLFDAMEMEKPFRIRTAAQDIMLGASDVWLTSADLRLNLQPLDIPRRIYRIIYESGSPPSYLKKFLNIMETLSNHERWHAYLREAMHIWLPIRDEGRKQVFHIFANLAKIPLPEVDDFTDMSLRNFVKDEWTRVPFRKVEDLTPDILGPFADVTARLKQSMVFNAGYWRAVSAEVEQVIPSLERRRNSDGHKGVGEDIHNIVKKLLNDLRERTKAGPSTIT